MPFQITTINPTFSNRELDKGFVVFLIVIRTGRHRVKNGRLQNKPYKLWYHFSDRVLYQKLIRRYGIFSRDWLAARHDYSSILTYDFQSIPKSFRDAFHHRMNAEKLLDVNHEIDDEEDHQFIDEMKDDHVVNVRRRPQRL